jgi:hypothetical protein
MQLNFLGASVQLTKTVEMAPDGTLHKTPYPNVFHVTSYEETVTDITEFHAALVKHAALGHCLLKGELSRPLVNESRAGSTNAAASTSWLCLDIDGIPARWTPAPSAAEPHPLTVVITPNAILQVIGLQDTSHILQWSASQGLDGNTTLRLHIFVQLSSSIPAAVIKQWLIQLNHTVPLLHGCQALTKTGNALTWGLDVTACQNDKLLYIAPPIFKNMKSPLGRTPRISLIKRLHPTFVFPNATNTTAQNQALTLTRVNELREQAGLPQRKFVTKLSGSVQILAKPESCAITETRTERGFVYFNLNGGDSWAYYHPEDRPDYIYNFKGEPNYLTKELLPEYWASLTTKATRTSSSGLTYLAFLDRRSGAYFRGTYEEATDTLDLNIAKNETQIRHFAEQNGVPLGSFIAEWDMTFDPQDPVRVDYVNKVINTFQLTEFMRATPKKVTKCPPTVLRIIHHALGSDIECTNHFINWLAFILQKRTRTLTAWVLHGTEGTGKGILMNRILRPILGRNQTASRRMEEFNEPYNAYMKQCFLVFVDEIEAKAFTNERGVMAKLRNFITEGTVTIRQMYASAVEWENFCNWIFASNKPEPVVIPKGDRRFNVGKYQPAKLGMTDTELARIPGELQPFHDFLFNYPVDYKAVATPLENADRTTMIAISESSIDTVANAIVGGDMEFLLDQLPATMAYSGNAMQTGKVENYKHALKTVMLRTDPLNGKCNISRDELHVIFTYVVGGNIPDSPNKFTSLLKHHRIVTKKVWCDSRAVYGMTTEFKDVANFGSYAATHFPAPPQPAQPLKLVKPAPRKAKP